MTTSMSLPLTFARVSVECGGHVWKPNKNWAPEAGQRVYAPNVTTRHGLAGFGGSRKSRTVMVPPIKPIETQYGGRKFRSRTEARFSIFLDTLKIPFDYELEGWEFLEGRYLPDFYLPDQKCWIELKPDAPNDREQLMARRLCIARNEPVYILSGAIRVGPFQGIDNRGIPQAMAFWPEHDVPGAVATDDGYSWCVCPDCDRFGITFQGRSDRLPCKKCVSCSESAIKSPTPDHCAGKCPRGGSKWDGAVTADHPRLIHAYHEAMSAQFEFVAPKTES